MSTKFKCTFENCDKEYVNKGHLDRHFNEKHTKRPSIVYRLEYLPEPIYQYIGSTQNTLKNRFQLHKAHSRANKDHKTSVEKFIIDRKASWDDFKIILIKGYHTVDKKHLSVYEQLAIMRYKYQGFKVINEYNTFHIKYLSNKAYVEANKDKIKEQQKAYCESNKDKIKEQKKSYAEANKEVLKETRTKYKKEHKQEISKKGKEYYEQNKEIIKEKVNVYREANKEIIKERQKDYRNSNKDKIKERKAIKIMCEVCNKEINKDHKARHERTKLHLSNEQKMSN